MMMGRAGAVVDWRRLDGPPEKMVLTPNLMAEPIDRDGDPSDDDVKGSPRLKGEWEG